MHKKPKMTKRVNYNVMNNQQLRFGCKNSKF